MKRESKKLVGKFSILSLIFSLCFLGFLVTIVISNLLFGVYGFFSLLNLLLYSLSQISGFLGLIFIVLSFINIRRKKNDWNLPLKIALIITAIFLIIFFFGGLCDSWGGYSGIGKSNATTCNCLGFKVYVLDEGPSDGYTLSTCIGIITEKTKTSS